MKFSLDLFRLSYILNNECNLVCTHCFQKHDNRHKQHLKIDDAVKFTKFAIENNTSCKRDIEITLIGGEPLLYKNILQLERCFDILFENGYSVKILRIFTNGTIYSKDLVKLIENLSKKGIDKQNIQILVTMDFLEDKPRRINHSGKSVNPLIWKNVKEYNKTGCMVTEQYVFTKEDVSNFEEILEVIKNDKNIKLEFGYPCITNNDLSKEDFKYMIDTFINFLNKNKELKKDYLFFKRCNYERMYYILYDYEYKELTKEENRLYRFKCDPIKGELSISPKGYIIPCVKLLSYEDEFSEFYIDNLNNIDIFSNEKILKYINYTNMNEDKEECDDCILKTVCTQCRLLPGLIDIESNKHIEHSLQKCDRTFNFYESMLNKYLELKGDEKWQK